ncbi:MAG: hypothetical protein ACOYO1_18850 [Bacteroidales bacterium]
MKQQLKKLECFIFGHTYKYFSTFTNRSTWNNSGQRFCTNCGKLQVKTKLTVREKLLTLLNK